MESQDKWLNACIKTNKKLNDILYGIPRHLANTTGQLALLTPMWAWVETYGFDGLRELAENYEPVRKAIEAIGMNVQDIYMSENASWEARKLGLKVFYAGSGIILAQGGRLSEKLWKITEDTSKKIRKTHDVLYGAAIGLAITPAFVKGTEILSGEDLGTPIYVFSTLTSMITTATLSPFLRDLGDTLETLTRTAPEKFAINRVPERIKQMSLPQKIATTAAIIAASAGSTWGIYQLHNEQTNPALADPIAETRTIDNLVESPLIVE